MYYGQLVFSQVMLFLPLHRFRQCVLRYKGNYKTQKFTCLDQYLCMVFAQLTYRESLRDIETCLNAQNSKLYHMGIRADVSRSTLAYANETKDWRIYADFAQVLIAIARPLYVNQDLGLEIKEALYALDSSTIDLCLASFPWAKFRKTKGAIKLHTLLDLRGSIPTFIHISDGKLHDVNVLDLLLLEAGAFYIMDRGYLDFLRLFQITQALAFFVTRAKRNFAFERIYSHPADKEACILCDQTIKLSNSLVSKDYPEKLRRIKFYDKERDKKLVFLTNNFSLPALTIAKLYKSRWQVELFFKWIKQHLRIKVFYGTSENAVKTQIWIAVSTYVLVAILKKRLNLEQSLYTILQVLSVNAFEKMPIQQLFAGSDYKNETTPNSNQLNLFG